MGPNFNWILLSSAENLCKQFEPRSGPTERRSWYDSKPFDTDKVLFPEFVKKKSADYIESNKSNGLSPDYRHSCLHSVRLIYIQSAYQKKKKILFLDQNICCVYSKESSHPKHMLKLMDKISSKPVYIRISDTRQSLHLRVCNTPIPHRPRIPRIDKYLDSWLNRTQFVKILTDSHSP